MFICYILRAIRAGRCRERRYADHTFIQIYFRMHHFVVRFQKFLRLRRQGGIDPLSRILRAFLITGVRGAGGPLRVVAVPAIDAARRSRLRQADQSQGLPVRAHVCRDRRAAGEVPVMAARQRTRPHRHGHAQTHQQHRTGI